MRDLTYTSKQICANLMALLTLIAITLYAPYGLAEINREDKLYTLEGYPYGPLVERIESVKIHYSSQEKDQVQCSVEIIGNGHNWKGRIRKVSQKKFEKWPLKSCLERDLAKQILASTY